jgi:hypothetical protein
VCSPSSTSWPCWLWIVARAAPGAVTASTCRPSTTGAVWPWLRAYDVAVDRMVVGGHGLERRGVGVGKGPAGRPEDVPDLEILERPRFDDREGGWIELVWAGGGWLLKLPS